MTSTSGYIIMKKGNSQMKSISEHSLVLVVSLVRFLVVLLRHGKVGHGPMSNLLKSHGLEQLPDNPTSRRIIVQKSEKMGQWVAKTSVRILDLLFKSRSLAIEMRWKSGDVNYRQSKYLTVKLFEIINGINECQ